jgi:hypothetical protein
VSTHLTDIEKAKWLVRIVRGIQSSAERAATRAQADFAGRRAAFKVWNDANPDDGCGGMSSNPYQEREYETAEVKRLEQAAVDATELTDFVVGRVLEVAWSASEVDKRDPATGKRKDVGLPADDDVSEGEG